MKFLLKIGCSLVVILNLFYVATCFADETRRIPILCYHNFNPSTPGSMNITPKTFEAQLKWLKDNGFHVIPLKDAVEYLQGRRETIPEKAVVITADDGWKSVYTYMYPLVRKYNVPVTLFIYPQTISSGKNAMTWEQLKELQQTGYFDIQSHTYWHPNFKRERKKLSPAAYEKFVRTQLVNSKKILEDKLGIQVTLLAWPFGIYDAYLEQQAKEAGYTMAFSIDDEAATKKFRPMAEPRFMFFEARPMKTFINVVNRANHQG